MNVELPFEKLIKVSYGRFFEGATHFEDIRSMLGAFLIIMILRLCTLEFFWSPRLTKKEPLKDYDVLSYDAAGIIGTDNLKVKGRGHPGFQKFHTDLPCILVWPDLGEPGKGTDYWLS